MGRVLQQLILLVKKNFILQYRRPVGAILELLLPCVFLLLISMTRFASPIEKHCFSIFDPMPYSKFNTKYQLPFSVIAVAPANPFVEEVVDNMIKRQEYLPGYIKRVEDKEGVAEFLQEADQLLKDALNMKIDMNKTSKFVLMMPDVALLDEVLNQKVEFFNAALEFTNTTSTAVDYKLRMASSIARRGRWYTERAYPYYFRPGPETYRGYDQGWIALQQLVEQSILEAQNITDIPVINIRQLPYPTWTEDAFANAIRNSLPLMIVISFLWIGASISKELVGEKCSRMKETMKMMGLSNWILWASWIIQRLILMFFTVVLMVIVLKGAQYLAHSSAIVIFLFLFEYAISVMCFCFFLSTLFSKTTTAIAGTMMGYFMLYVPYFFLGNEFDTMTNGERYAGCLLSSTCMGFGANIISKWETMQEGIQFSNIGSMSSDLDTFTLGDVMLMLAVDIVIYSLLTWYVEAVFPGDYGIAQRPWFFVTRKYWLGSAHKVVEVDLGEKKYIRSAWDYDWWTDQRKKLSKLFHHVMGPISKKSIANVLSNYVDKESEVELADFAAEKRSDPSAHEDGPKDKKKGIVIKGLVKKFNTPNGKMTAVDHLSMDMFEDQITSLLGHNGAGKTTTMSMLTGLFSPSAGEAYINNFSILQDMDKVRDSLGICPQHNVLFDRLTVAEHLDFFIRLKGLSGDIVAEEVQKMVEMLKLTDKKATKADQLSGGMKRKLSVGIALSGGSKVVILDEPTAGMDPYARRATWDLILENKAGRTILLTTHYMDEADFLGDRVAIMASGKLVCSGSSMFLKKKYGIGYHLTMVKKPDCDVTKVDKFIKSYVSSAKQISNVGTELVYVMSSTETDKFVALFRKLEGTTTPSPTEDTLERKFKRKFSYASDITDLLPNLTSRLDKTRTNNNAMSKIDDSMSIGIESFGLSLTTMEEVFMKVGEEQEDHNVAAINDKLKFNGGSENMNGGSEKMNGHSNGDTNMSNGGSEPTQFKVFKKGELNRGPVLLAQQFRAMIIKRFINTKRYKKGIVSQLVLPMLFTLLGLLVVLTFPETPAEPARLITLKDYPGQGIKGNVFFAEASGDTSDPFGSYFYLQSFHPYFTDELGYNIPLDIMSNMSLKRAHYEDADYATNSSKCCDDSALQLNKNCTDRGSTIAAWAECKTVEAWSYQSCYATCLTPLEDATETCDANVKMPDSRFIGDDTAYFANAFLDNSRDGDSRYYRKHQTAFTYSEVPRNYRLDYRGYKMYNTSTDTMYTMSTVHNTTDTQYMMTGWYSHEGLHLAPGVVNAMSNLILANHSKTTRISVTNHPLPKSLQDRFDESNITGAGSALSVLMLLGFSFLTSSFCLFIVEERENKSKHLQQISGVNGVVYWCGTFCWDILNYLVCIVCIIILFAIFQVDGYKGASIGTMFVVLLMYGYCSIPFVYFLSLAFSSPVTAFSIIAVGTFISGWAGFIANLILTILDDDFQPTLNLILHLLPNYCFVNSITNIYGHNIRETAYSDCLTFGGENITTVVKALCNRIKPGSIFEPNEQGIGTQLIAMAALGTVCFIFVLLQEVFWKSISLGLSKMWSSFWSTRSVRKEGAMLGEDEDVQKERTRLLCDQNTAVKEDAVVMFNLRKEYGSNVAVQNLSLGIPHKECFGLLGVNGAGKTTTFSMLTGEVSMTEGEAYLMGYSIQKDLRQIQQRIGYCPQFDALIGIMTGRELLTMFANLRGIPSHAIANTVNEAVTNLNLEEYADKLCGTYSGGNKRKLSTAVALVGNPPVLFLDEPTAGMDPGARRFLWNVLCDLTKNGTSIVLTSHSMEECEALCNRLVIMVNGAFRCLGSIQHLKNKYGKGYTLTIKVEEERQQECLAFVQQAFPGAVCKEEHTGYLHFELGPDVRWSTIFDQMEVNKEGLSIEDYAVNQTSLEQVFLNFAKEQTEEEPQTKAGCFNCLCCKKKTDNKVDREGSSLRRRNESRVSMNRAASVKR